MTPQDVIALVRSQQIEFIDCRFLDFPGLWQHCTYAASELSVESFEQGFGFDGSALRGWQEINESDMLLVPVANTAHVDPFTQRPTLNLLCDIKDPVTRKRYSRDPRSIARKAEQYLIQSNIADQAMFGPELEFFVFDRVMYDQTNHRAVYEIDSVEGIWNRGHPGPTNLGNQIRRREGHFPCPPVDTLSDLRSEMAAVMRQIGMQVECHHHEVATGGQCEIDLRYAPLLRMADQCLMYKYVVKQVAARHGKVATFMPKPLWDESGSGMHTHFSLWKEGRNIFAGNRYAGLSAQGLHAIGGLLRHGPALLALTNPTTNSFKRLVPGFEAPVNLTYSSRNRSAAIRIPTYQSNSDTKRLEVRWPDASCNSYLAFAALTMAALDGIRHQMDPGDPIDKNLYALAPEDAASLPQMPVDLEAALAALEADHAFLLEGDVFTPDVIHNWIRYKREQEVAALRARPHPYEFCMYFDI